MIGGTDPGMTIGNLARIGADSGQEFLHILRREAIAHHKKQGRAGNQPNRLQFTRVILDGPIDRRRRRMTAEAAHRQRIAIRCRLRTARPANRAAGARDILNRHALVQRFHHMVSHNARQHIGGTAGGEDHKHIDGAIGEILRGGRLGEAQN